MRDINKYEDDYIELMYEQYQVKYRKRMLLEQLQQFNHKRLLEIGCGLEPIYKFISDYDQMVIIEPADKFYSAIKNDSTKKSNVICIHGFFEDHIEELKQYDFDFIVISSLLHEVEDPEKMLALVNKICSKNAVVHINVPNAMSLHRLLAFEMGLIKSVFQPSETQIKMQQQSIFDINSLSNLVKKNGFSVINSGSYYLKMFTHAQMQQLVDQKLITPQMMNGFYKMVKYMPNFGSEIFINCKKHI